MEHICKKIKFEDNPTSWSHHRGGWSYAFQALNDLNAPDGVLCVSAIEELVCNDRVINEPWVGFVHQAPQNNYKWYPDLDHLVANECFVKSLDNCYGLITLSSVIKSYLLKSLSQRNIPVVRLFYPITPFPEEKRFEWGKYDQVEINRVIFIGEYLRNYQSFFDLVVPMGFQKYLLKAPDVNFKQLLDCKKEPMSLKTNDTVIVISNRVSDEEYDSLLSSSVVFLDLYDAVANTTAIECMGRNTPLVINRLPGIEEYLGKEYPLFYDTLKDAAAILSNRGRLEDGVLYLKKWYHHIGPLRFTAQSFLQSFINSSIYRSLPLPPSQKRDPQQTKFPLFDLSVVICCYKRVYNLEHQLNCLKKQDYCGSFELILWNNNPETHREVADITAPYIDELNIRLIQSSTNYYCIIRLAVAKLMRSKLLLICDDDVVPKPSYISTFIAKYNEYGPRVALCCRGHVFTQPHYLNEEEPQLFWDSHENNVMKFYDERVSDRQVSILPLHKIEYTMMGVYLSLLTIIVVTIN